MYTDGEHFYYRSEESPYRSPRQVRRQRPVLSMPVAPEYPVQPEREAAGGRLSRLEATVEELQATISRLNDQLTHERARNRTETAGRGARTQMHGRNHAPMRTEIYPLPDEPGTAESYPATEEWPDERYVQERTVRERTAHERPAAQERPSAQEQPVQEKPVQSRRGPSVPAGPGRVQELESGIKISAFAGDGTQAILGEVRITDMD